MLRKIGYLLTGMLFGFVLSRSGASDYYFIHKMFTGENLKLAFLMGTAIVTGAIGMQIVRLAGNKDVKGKDIQINRKPLNKYTIIGGALFGIGWAVTGACPGTVLAQIGEGKLLALFTLVGMVFGTFVYALNAEKNKNL